VEEFGLSIDYNLQIKNSNPTEFISDAISKISSLLMTISPDAVLVMGDTNSSLAAAIVSNKLSIPLFHIEAGIRCGKRERPEEINRIIVDDLSDVHFISRNSDACNVRNPVFVGDLEYVLLNRYVLLNSMMDFEKISYENWILMTIHRDDNMNKNRLQSIFSLCEKIGKDVIFPMHHRTRKYVDDNNIIIPDNIKVIDPVSYTEMCYYLSNCLGVITDSGGISKITPFFGKKSIIPSIAAEWDEIITSGYATLSEDEKWFNDPIITRRKDFYYNSNCCNIIYSTVCDYSSRRKDT
jgi:UDP-GlcNAc3NAcA epimerase